jgi:hypothetical protein
MSRARYIIETREPAVDDPLDHRPATPWTRDTLGEEEARATYPSRAAAERQIKALRRLGGEWAEREYRVREAGTGASQPEADRTARVVSLRLAPATLTALDALATRWNLSRSGWVTEMTRILSAMPPERVLAWMEGARDAELDAITASHSTPLPGGVDMGGGTYVRGPSFFARALSRPK